MNSSLLIFLSTARCCIKISVAQREGVCGNNDMKRYEPTKEQWTRVKHCCHQKGWENETDQGKMTGAMLNSMESVDCPQWSTLMRVAGDVRPLGSLYIPDFQMAGRYHTGNCVCLLSSNADMENLSLNLPISRFIKVPMAREKQRPRQLDEPEKS